MTSCKLDSNKINKQHFLIFCHEIYDQLYGKEKINEIFDIHEHQINIINEIYRKNFITRLNKINNYINDNTEIKDNLASSFYVNAFQHYLQIGP